jgi:hypothetical protein
MFWVIRALELDGRQIPPQLIAIGHVIVRSIMLVFVELVESVKSA